LLILQDLFFCGYICRYYFQTSQDVPYVIMVDLSLSSLDVLQL
jgi:hypothetical protein